MISVRKNLPVIVLLLLSAWSLLAMDNYYVIESGSGEFTVNWNSGKAWLQSAAPVWDRENNFILPSAGDSEGLWRLEFRTPDGADDSAVIITPDTRSPYIEPQADGGVALYWQNLKLQENYDVDVAVYISPLTENGMTDWRIEVINRSETLGLWEVCFPIINGLSVSEEGESFVPFGTGQIEHDPVMNGGFSGTYPNALYSMQFMGVTENDTTVYLATHDHSGYVKGTHFLPHKNRDLGMLYMTVQYPEDMGIPGKNYLQPYPVIIGFLPGNWYDAAKFYRSWVLAESEWMCNIEPIAVRKDWPGWFKKLPFWIGYHGMTDDNQQKALSTAEFVGVPTAVHMYHWHQITFDTHYPDFWPPFGNALEYAAEMQANGIKIMPYINCHLIDQQSESWKNENGATYMAMPPKGQKAYTEIWTAGEGVKLTPLCPATDYWQNKYLPLTGTLLKEMNIDGLYLDQVACVKPDLCFNPEHGHPLGGGKHWVEGYAKMIQNIRAEADKSGKFIFLTTESAAEPYDFDIFLRCNEGAAFLSPIWQTVYSGYRASFGYYFQIPEEWLPKLAKQYLEGIQIGWAPLHAELPEKGKAFQREVARARYAGADYLAMGELLRPPVVSGNISRFFGKWWNFGTVSDIDWPAVQASLWQAYDGTYAIAFVNLADTSQEAVISFTDWQIADREYTVHAIYPENLFEDFTVQCRDYSGSVTITLPPCSAGIITLE